MEENGIIKLAKENIIQKHKIAELDQLVSKLKKDKTINLTIKRDSPATGSPQNNFLITCENEDIIQAVKGYIGDVDILKEEINVLRNDIHNLRAVKDIVPRLLKHLQELKGNNV